MIRFKQAVKINLGRADGRKNKNTTYLTLNTTAEALTLNYLYEPFQQPTAKTEQGIFQVRECKKQRVTKDLVQVLLGNLLIKKELASLVELLKLKVIIIMHDTIFFIFKNCKNIEKINDYTCHNILQFNKAKIEIS